MVYVALGTLASLYLSSSVVTGVVLGVTADPSILSVLGARVLLNLKAEGEKCVQGTSIRERSTIIGIEFALPPLRDVDGSLDGAAEDAGEEGTAVVEEIAF